jgi:anti-sigma regulatory factor (Ser/Thr protein kinase)
MEASTQFPSDPASASAARSFVAEILEEWGDGVYVLETAVLLTSELVTNAILHARSPVTVAVSSTNGTVRIGVDGDGEQDPIRQAGSDALGGGRGLHVVEALADRWGTTAGGSGKTVWFELASAYQQDGSGNQVSGSRPARLPTWTVRRPATQHARHLASWVQFSRDDPDAMRTTRHLVELVNRAPQEARVERALETAVSFMKADFGNIQMFDPTTGSLTIVAQDGFSPEFLEYFAVVDDDSAACGRAAETGTQTVIENVYTDPGFAPHREIAAASGFGAVQSTPLNDYSGKLIGMLSTHFSHPHRPSARDLGIVARYGDYLGEVLSAKVSPSASNDPATQISRAVMAAVLDAGAAKAGQRERDGLWTLLEDDGGEGR